MSSESELESELAEVRGQIRALRARETALEKALAAARTKKEQDRLEKLHSRDWEHGENFPWSNDLKSALKSRFGIDQFRPLQLSTINASLSGHDVFLIMPTGGGKSLCYQLPALLDCEHVQKGFTVVVSPLVALMEDQVMALRRVGVTEEEAVMLNADTPREMVTKVMNSLTAKGTRLRLLYVTPEKLAKSKRLMNKLQAAHKANNFRRLAIDEVHCCSQWGHDFRPDYKFLGVMRTLFPDVPILGLTATSTATVTDDVKQILGLNACMVFKAAFNRPNLFYEVLPKPEGQDASVEALSDLLSGDFAGQSGIIYALSIKDVETLTQALRSKGLRVAPYHANLETKDRSRVHKRWLSGEYQVVVATIAFGMGIDKPDVRFVIHHSVSKSMENFYQESGRAGRDDFTARCISFFAFSDVFRLSTMVFTERTGLEKLYGLVAYAVNRNTCRRALIADHFDEASSWDAALCNNMCDNCRKQSPSEDLKDEPDICSASRLERLKSTCAPGIKAILVQAEQKDVRLTGLKLTNALLGKGDTKIRVKSWTPPSDLDKTTAEHVLLHFLLEGYLKEDFAFTPYSTISYLVRGPVDLSNYSDPPKKRQIDFTAEPKKKKARSEPEIVDLE